MNPTKEIVSCFQASYDADLAKIFHEKQRRERESFLKVLGAKQVVGADVELTDKEQLFTELFASAQPGQLIVGTLPCLRDNSPESARLAELMHEKLWDFWTAEELSEIIRDAGFEVIGNRTQFRQNPRWNEAVLKGELQFQGYHSMFEVMMAEGFEPSEIGWGELWFVAKKP